MKNLVRIFLVATVVSVSTWSCNTAEQDVEPIVSPADNAVVTITPREAVTTVSEGDTLWFDLVANKMIDGAVEFSPVFAEDSESDGDDIEVIGGTLAAYSLNAEIGIIILSDAAAEAGEAMTFEISYANDLAHSWRLSPNSDFEMVSLAVKSFDYTLDWSTGIYEGEDMCEWHIDLDTYVANADFSVGDFSGATGACPSEAIDLLALPNDTYDIYVDYWDGDLPAGIAIDIPYTVYFSNNAGSAPYEITGVFNSDNIGESRIVGQIVVSNGTYTILDENGATIGSI